MTGGTPSDARCRGLVGAGIAVASGGGIPHDAHAEALADDPNAPSTDSETPA